MLDLILVLLGFIPLVLWLGLSRLTVSVGKVLPRPGALSVHSPPWDSGRSVFSKPQPPRRLHDFFWAIRRCFVGFLSFIRLFSWAQKSILTVEFGNFQSLQNFFKPVIVPKQANDRGKTIGLKKFFKLLEISFDPG